MRFLKQFDDFLGRGEGFLLVGLLSVMVLLSFVQVVLRNLFAETLLWGEILLRHLVLWVGFLGAARATGEGRHITIDALTRFLPTQLRLLARVITNTFALVVCFFLLRASLTFLSDEIEVGSVLYGDIPSWYSQIIIPVGFGLIMMHFFVRIIRGIAAIRAGESAE